MALQLSKTHFGLLLRWSVLPFILAGCSQGFVPKEGLSAASSAAPTNSALTPSPAPSAPPQTTNDQIQKARITVWGGSLSSGYGMAVFRVVDQEEYTIFFTALPVAAGSSPIMFTIDDPRDNPENINSVRLADSANQTIASGGCNATFGCSIAWSRITSTKQCKPGDQTWIYPTAGSYKLVAAYKDGSSRSVSFRIADPCASLLTAQAPSKNSIRQPASIKSKRTENR